MFANISVQFSQVTFISRLLFYKNGHLKNGHERTRSGHDLSGS